MCFFPTYYELVMNSFNALLKIAINILKKYKNSWIYVSPPPPPGLGQGSCSQ